MTIPVGYSLAPNGFYYYTDGSGPYNVNQAGVATLVGSGGGGGGGGVTDHGLLTGLADNDHPQYALTASLATVATSGSYNDLLNQPTANSLNAAPNNADVLVRTANAALSAERVVTDSLTVVADWSTPGQVSFNALPSIIGAPTDVDYLVKTASTSLTNELVVTNSSTILADWSTPGQVKFTVAGSNQSTTVPTDFKDSALVATTGNITLVGEQTIDGVLTSASRVLVKNQTLGAQNGIYVSSAAAWVRSADADTDAEVTAGMLIYVESGTVGGNQVYILTTTGAIVVGVTTLTFVAINIPFSVFVGKTVAGTAYTHILTDAGKRLNLTNAATKTVTIAPQSSVNSAVNTEIEIFNAGAGLATLAPGAGVTLNSLGGVLTVSQYQVVQLKKRANPNTWDVTNTLSTSVSGNVVQGRLTLESGVPVSTSDQTAKSTVYFTPYKGNQIQLWDGSAWTTYIFTQTTLALGTLLSGKNYDIFGYQNSGTLTLELLAWTNDSTRATAVTLQDGRYCKSSDKTRLYLGTFRTTSTTTTEDSAGGVTSQVGGKRFLWNYYNRIDRHIYVFDTTDNWSYTSSAIRQANGVSGNKVEFVIGIAEDVSHAQVVANIYVASSSTPAKAGIGINSIASFLGLVGNAYDSTASGYQGNISAAAHGILPAGYNYFAWLESGSSTTCVYIGDGNSVINSGLTSSVKA